MSVNESPNATTEEYETLPLLAANLSTGDAKAAPADNSTTTRSIAADKGEEESMSQTRRALATYQSTNLPSSRGWKEGRKGDPREDRKGRDSVMFAACWDDWEAGGRELVEAALLSR